MTTLVKLAGEARKFLLTIAGFLGSILATGLVQGALFTKVTLAVAIVGAVASALVYVVANVPAATPPVAPSTVPPPPA